ncbi:MAG: hypothetical protein IT290_04760, partial [Deltaproteobacteria bacterium]|nr:hypothetical protein [Deltaproteobacteria bacterium]
MTSSQRRRLYFLAFLMALATIILLPTFLRGRLPEWYSLKPVKLGLDLRGGSYLVLTVKTDEAVKSHLASMATEIRALLRKEKVGVLRTRQTGEQSIEVTLINRDGLTALDAIVRKEFLGLLPSGSPAGETNVKVVYDMQPLQVEELKKRAVEQAIETIRNRVDS